MPKYIYFLCALFLTGCALTITPESSNTTAIPPVAALTTTPLPTVTSETITPISISQVELLGIITIPNNTVAFNTPVGGLSAIAYDDDNGFYYFLSDDRATWGPVRIYQATIDVNDGSLDEGDLMWTGMISLLDESGAPFAQGLLDPEGLVYLGESFYVSTEGDTSAQPPITPAILQFTNDGDFLASLPIPDAFMPLADGSRGVRNTKGFESLTHTPDNRYLISGVENALVQDGPEATLADRSPSRLLTLDLASGSAVEEYLYEVEAIPATPATGEADNGLAELIALDNHGTLLALERSYVQGVGNTVRLFVASTQEATDVSGIESLGKESFNGETTDAPVSKELLVDFGELGGSQGIKPDNLEGMALGPQLADGRYLLLVVSDNNFNPSQRTQLWALALTLSE